jgi:hypothetical protein
MSNEAHWLIKGLHESNGNSPDEHIDPSQLKQHESAKMVLHSPRERMDYLNQLAAAIGKDDGTSLKSRAELVDLHRELSRTHKQLLQLKR